MGLLAPFARFDGYDCQVTSHHTWEFSISKRSFGRSLSSRLARNSGEWSQSRTSEAVVKRARDSYKYKEELACKHENESIKNYKIIYSIPSNSMHVSPKLKNIHIYPTLFPRENLKFSRLLILCAKRKQEKTAKRKLLQDFIWLKITQLVYCSQPVDGCCCCWELNLNMIWLIVVNNLRHIWWRGAVLVCRLSLIGHNL